MEIIKKHLEDVIDKEYWEGNDPQCIIWHTLLGTIEGSYAWVEHINLSYNFMIGKDGKIYELVEPERSAWHAGVVSNPTQRVKEFFNGVNPNRKSIGVGFERNREPELTKEQVISAVWLAQEMAKRFNVPLTARERQFAHCEITDYKPKEVLDYMESILHRLEGEKGEDNKDKEIEELKAKITMLEQIIALYKKIISFFMNK